MANRPGLHCIETGTLTTIRLIAAIVVTVVIAVIVVTVVIAFFRDHARTVVGCLIVDNFVANPSHETMKIRPRVNGRDPCSHNLGESSSPTHSMRTCPRVTMWVLALQRRLSPMLQLLCSVPLLENVNNACTTSPAK